jgi:putative ABC transport system permease protein
MSIVMEGVVHDLRHFSRLCLRNRGFTVIAVITLALGIGATIAVFTIVNAILLRPLPYSNPSELVHFTYVTPQRAFSAASATKFNIWMQLTGTVTNVSAHMFGVVNVMGTDEPEQVPSGLVSADFFRLLGAPILLGRAFSSGDDRPGAERVAVISHSLWQRHFNADRNVIGRAISLNGNPHVVIGVIDDFDAAPLRSYTGTPEIWLPLEIDPDSIDHGNYFGVLARLSPGVTLEAARTRVRGSADEFRRRFPGVIGPADSFGLLPMQEVLVGDSQTPLRVLAVAVALLLLTACGNVATLLLARGSTRGGEIAIRSAVGASRRRILRQLLTESVMLAAVGGALGLVLGTIGIDAMLAVTPANLTWLGSNGVSIRPDVSVVIFALTVSVLTGVIFGVAPSLTLSRNSIDTGLRRLRQPGQTRLRSVLVVSQTAIAVVLLIGAILLMRSLVAMRAVNTGFDSGNVMTMRMSLAGPKFVTTGALNGLVQGGVERIRAIPGVLAAGASFGLPLEDDMGLRFAINGRPLDGAYHGTAGWRMVSPEYFDVFKIPLIRGHGFTKRDRAGTPGVIISETMARQFWPNSDPLLDQLIIGRGLGPAFDETPRQIIGISRDVRDGALNRAPQPVMYVSLAQLSDGITAINAALQPLAWVVRTQASPYAFSAAIADSLRQSSGGLPVARVRSMDDVLSESVSAPRFNTLILAVFSASALLLAMIGIYGLMSYSIQQRDKELAIRLALGAAPGSLQRMLLGHAASLAITGLVIGLSASAGLTRLLTALLFGVTASDPFTLITVSALLCASATLAAWFPVRRVGRVAPITALRLD